MIFKVDSFTPISVVYDVFRVFRGETSTHLISFKAAPCSQVPGFFKMIGTGSTTRRPIHKNTLIHESN